MQGSERLRHVSGPQWLVIGEAMTHTHTPLEACVTTAPGFEKSVPTEESGVNKRLSVLFASFICLMREGWVTSWTSPTSEMCEFLKRKLPRLFSSRACAGFCLGASSSTKRQVLLVSVTATQEAGPAKLPSRGLGFPRLQFHGLWRSQQEYNLCLHKTRTQKKRSRPH